MNDYKILKKKLQMVAWIKTTLCSVGNSTARSSLKLAMTHNLSLVQMGQMKKDQFIRFLRSYIGDKVLTTVAKRLRGC
jgi:hypothetical protein